MTIQELANIVEVHRVQIDLLQKDIKRMLFWRQVRSIIAVIIGILVGKLLYLWFLA